MGLAVNDNIYLYSATRLQDVLAEILSMRPRAVIVDSIQTVYLDDVNGSAGSVSQVRSCLAHCTAYLLAQCTTWHPAHCTACHPAHGTAHCSACHFAHCLPSVDSGVGACHACVHSALVNPENVRFNLETLSLHWKSSLRSAWEQHRRVSTLGRYVRSE